MAVVHLIEYLIWPLTVTLIVELLVGMLVVRDRTYIQSIIVVNVITNPLLNLFLILFIGRLQCPYMVVVSLMEGIVFMVEGYLLMLMNQINIGKALKLSFIMNASSYLLGVAIQ